MLHVDLLAKLEQIKANTGRTPKLYASLSAWRSHAVQKELYDRWRAGKGNPASNPDTGNRTHMRGVAADLADTSAAMQRACVAVGLQRDYAEAWHWQLPNWRDYPIIEALPEPEQETEDIDMLLLTINDGNGRYGPKGKSYWAVSGSGYWWETEDQTLADPLSVRLGNQPALNLTYDQWEDAKKASTIRPGVAGDDSRVLEAIAEVPAKTRAAIIRD